MSFSHTKSNCEGKKREMRNEKSSFSSFVLLQSLSNTICAKKIFRSFLTSITIEDCTSVLLYSQPLSQCCKGHDSFGTSESISASCRIKFQSTAYRRHLSYTCSPFFCSRLRDEEKKRKSKSNLVKLWHCTTDDYTQRWAEIYFGSIYEENWNLIYFGLLAVFFLVSSLRLWLLFF